MHASRRRYLGALAGAVLAVPALAEAQVCLGRPSVREGPAIVSGSASYVDQTSTYGAGLTVGSQSGLFASASYGFSEIDGLDESTTNLGAMLGAAIPSGTSGLEFCPVVGYAHASLPRIQGVKVTARQIMGGLGVGAAVGDRSSSMQLVPFALLQYGSTRLTIDDDLLGSGSESETSGLFSLGAGLMMNRMFSIVPEVTFPINVDDGETMLTISFAVLLGQRR